MQMCAEIKAREIFMRNIVPDYFLLSYVPRIYFCCVVFLFMIIVHMFVETLAKFMIIPGIIFLKKLWKIFFHF